MPRRSDPSPTTLSARVEQDLYGPISTHPWRFHVHHARGRWVVVDTANDNTPVARRDRHEDAAQYAIRMHYQAQRIGGRATVNRRGAA